MTGVEKNGCESCLTNLSNFRKLAVSAAQLGLVARGLVSEEDIAHEASKFSQGCSGPDIEYRPKLGLRGLLGQKEAIQVNCNSLQKIQYESSEESFYNQNEPGVA